MDRGTDGETEIQNNTNKHTDRQTERPDYLTFREQNHAKLPISVRNSKYGLTIVLSYWHCASDAHPYTHRSIRTHVL